MNLSLRKRPALGSPSRWEKASDCSPISGRQLVPHEPRFTAGGGRRAATATHCVMGPRRDLFGERGPGCERTHSVAPAAAAQSSPQEQGATMRAYLKAVALTAGLLGAWMALLPLVA